MEGVTIYQGHSWCPCSVAVHLATANLWKMAQMPSACLAGLTQPSSGCLQLRGLTRWCCLSSPRHTQPLVWGGKKGRTGQPQLPALQISWQQWDTGPICTFLWEDDCCVFWMVCSETGQLNKYRISGKGLGRLWKGFWTSRGNRGSGFCKATKKGHLGLPCLLPILSSGHVLLLLPHIKKSCSSIPCSWPTQ